MKPWHVTREDAWHWAAGRVPKRLVYFVVIRAWAYATTGKYGNTEARAITATEVVERWHRHMKGR